MIPATLAETMRRILETHADDLHVAFPGVVQSYNEERQEADILPGLRRYVRAQDEEAPDETEPVPVLPAVPVLWPGGGGAFFHAGLEAGDGVLVIVCSTDPGAWRASNGERQVEPLTPTRSGLSGAVAIPLYQTRSRSFSPSGPSLGLDGNAAQIAFVPGQIQAGGAAPVARATNLDQHLAMIASTLQTIGAGLTVPVVPSPAVYMPGPGMGKAVLDASHPIPTSILRGDG